MPRIAPKPSSAKGRRSARHTGARWQLQDAKARFSQVVKDAQKKPQVITLRGEEIAVVQSIRDYKKSRSSQGPNLIEALLKCPPGPPLVIDRDPNDTVGALSPNVFD